jgi:O-succinylbenzoic acid--CoA ligase
MKIRNWLTASATAFPERIALITEDERVTYSELQRRVGIAARRLAALGVGGGDLVALVLEPSGPQVVLLHALMGLGAVSAPLDPRLTRQELDARLERLDASLVIDDPRQVEEAPGDGHEPSTTLELDSVLCVIHTSGSGGEAKPVELTYANHLWSALGSASRIGVDPEDRWLCCLPLHHVGGLSIVLRSALYGTAIVLTPFDPERIHALVGGDQATLASLVGTMLGRLLDAGAELDRTRCVLLGGGPVPSELIERALDAGVPLAPTYGLTEAASQVTTLPPGQARRKPGSAGTPILPTEVRIEQGTILVRGPTVAQGEVAEDGWLWTGDLGWIDDEGHLHVYGRGDELIVTGGENVSPEEVEQTLCAHPAVADAGVRGKADPEWQRAVVAAVVLHDGVRISESELRSFCRERLAGFKVPKEIVFVDRLPRNAQGKLVRGELAV